MSRSCATLLALFSLLVLSPGCECGGPAVGLDAGAPDAPPVRDAEARDGGDAEPGDGGGLDAAIDAAVALDGGAMDAGPPDAGRDAGPPDAGRDAGPPDAGTDAGPPDAGRDAGPPDAGRDAGPPSGGCISGATGTHVARFRWAGSGSGSTAYVMYEANTLPDTSRWRAGAYSTSIGYTPRFEDTFLGAGGLAMSGTVFMDTELSTLGLTSLSSVTIAIYGRSYNTTASGSFSWQTFSGTGATPSGSVANSAPYEWYPGDATLAFRPGDGGILLRLRAGPPSGSLVVNRVEICFTGS